MAGIDAREWSQLARNASNTNLVEAPGPDVILWPWEVTVEDEKRLAANHDRVIAALGSAVGETVSFEEPDNGAYTYLD